MTAEQVLESGVLDLLNFNFRILKPSNVTSTMHKIPDRVIDLVMVEESVSHVVKDVTADTTTPLLHFGLSAKICARPRTEKILVLVSPKKLPHDEAIKKYDSLNDFENINHTAVLIRKLDLYYINSKRRPGSLF